MAGFNHISRRDFVMLATVAVGSIIGVAIGLPGIDFLIDPALKARKTDAWIPLGKLAGFEIGKPALVTFTRSKANGWEKTVNSYGVFVIRKSDTQVLVLSNKCTHLGCRVNWKEDRKQFVCPCHDAQFSLDGKVLGGPPPRPLDSYSGNQIKIENETLFFHLQEG